MIRYFASLPNGKIALWCYLIWYLVTLGFYFDPSPAIWLNAAGISAIIGIALLLSVSLPPGAKRDPWQTFRLFMMPFGVSSFSQLIKGQGFILIFSPRSEVLLTSVISCLVFISLVILLRLSAQRGNTP